MTRILSVVSVPPPGGLRATVAGWLRCGTALPWVTPKRHLWAQQTRVQPWASTTLVCTRCARRMEF